MRLVRVNTRGMSAPLGCLVIALMVVTWVVCVCVSILVGALLTYGLWDLGRFLLGA